MTYIELSIEERSTIQISLWQEICLRQIATMLQRSPSTTVGIKLSTVLIVLNMRKPVAVLDVTCAVLSANCF